MATIIISEIGENHLGNMDIAMKMIEISKQCGADYAKFQLYDPEATSIDDPEREWFFQVAITREQTSEIVSTCKKNDIKPLFTAWDIQRAQWCLDEGVTEIKLASFHIIDMELLGFIAENFKTVFLSTGMSSIGDIEAAVKVLGKVENLYLLHCISDYPAKDEDLNLRFMDTLRKFTDKVGYSDHSLGTAAPVLAVALGAVVIEKHFTLSKHMPGTDHVLSADPEELKLMVSEIRKAEAIIGSDTKVMTPGEQENQEFLRKRFTFKQ